MKNLILTTIIALLTAGWSIAGAQNYPDEYLGLPGDNLNLYAVMKLFQESETLEDFEKSLNDENAMANNLDLNGDNMVDYIMVYDYVDGNVHNIVLRVAINQQETQDVAVFTVQQFKNGSVQVQLIGDELLYGKNYIVEPYYAENGATPNPGYTVNTRKAQNVTVIHTNTYQVAEWPIVRFIYLPTYVAWRSSWYWGYRPVYWNPWRPFYWHTYYGYHYNYHNHYYAYYRHWNHYRYPRYKNHYYTNIRTYSPRITVNINKGVYKTTYSRPDLRKQGEVLYARNNSGRNSTTYRSAENSRTRSASTSTVRSARTNVQSNTAGTRSTVRSSAATRNSAERKSATVNSSRNSTNSTVRSHSGTVRSSSSSTPQRSAVSSPARSSAPKKSATVSTGRSTSGPSVSRSTSSTRSSAPSVSRQSAPKTKSAPAVSKSRSTSRQSTPSVSRSSSSGSSRSAAPKSSNSRSSSTRSSGRR
ncbi:MAG: hypothetical protein K0B11_03875 [Mariniphaga sp.]|nr:hypothetical protein [Mariniphaga sp.]